MVSAPARSPHTARLPAASRFRSTADRLLAARRDLLIRNAYILTLSTLATSLFGAAYWALGARWYNADVVGRNYAAVSAMMLLGGIGQLNLGNVMMRFVPSAGRRTAWLVGRAYLATTVATLLLTAGFVLLIPVISPGLDFLHTAVLGSCFVAATAAYAIFNLQDGVLTGLRRPEWVTLENGVFSVEKIALLAILVAAGTVNGILVSWMAALVLVLVMTNAYIFARAIPRHRRRPAEAHADRSTVTTGYIAADYAGALCWLIALNLPPVIILNRLGAADSAYFSLAWLVAFVLFFFSSNMGYSLIVESTNNLTRLSDYRRVLWHAGRVLVAVVVPLIVFAPWLLRIFGPAYADHGTAALRLLALSALPNLLITTVVAMSRVRRRMKVVVGVLAVQAVLVLGLTWLLLPSLGLNGAAAAWLIAECVVAGALLLRSSWWLPDPVPHGFVPVTPPTLLYRLPDRITARRLAREVFPDGERVTLRSARRTPGGLLVVRLDRLDRLDQLDRLDRQGEGDRTSVAVKHPLSERAARTLADERAVLRRLAEDERVEPLRRLVPGEVACRLGGPLPLVAETWLPGRDAGTMLRRDPEALSRVTAASSTALRELYSATGRREDATAHLGTWVDARVDVVAREVGWCSRDGGSERLEALRGRLREGLAGRTMEVGWTHGDFAAGNILVTEDGTAVTGVIDWSTACADGPVSVDAYTLVLTAQYELSGQTFGQVVADIVRSGRLTDAQVRLLAGFGSTGAFGSVGSVESAGSRESGGSDPDADAALLPLLTWLWHVANNASKSSRYGRSARWVRGNVVPVLEAVSR